MYFVRKTRVISGDDLIKITYSPGLQQFEIEEFERPWIKDGKYGFSIGVSIMPPDISLHQRMILHLLSDLQAASL